MCQALGHAGPIVEAPLPAVPRLTAAASKAGAPGMVTLTWSEDAGAVVRQTAALTTRPLCGNFYSPKITTVLATSFLTRRYRRRREPYGAHPERRPHIVTDHNSGYRPRRKRVSGPTSGGAR